ncbi:MFS transporter [Brevibacillus composti]|uniref:MFS transporter n=1 Tax=Brevibacillus composti TaxID=2796470 RepID=A0A7T5EN29_9BACL|nr:MFS transporter [Brevibacillus composti]QQE75596.1 MFS transporter [Brevibacillus composti]QUO42622.1 MFS transporter [Brevibacillus composti]
MKELWGLVAFRWYWFGLFLSSLGNSLGWMALAWFVMKKTGSPVAMGGVVLSYMLSAVAAGLVVGVLLDRFNRQRLIIWDNILRGLIFIALVAVLQLESVPLWIMYVLIVLAGILSPLSSAGTQALLPRLVPDKELLVKANGLMESQWQITGLFGPVLAGLLIGVIGEGMVLLLDVCAMFVCAYCFGRIPSAMLNHSAGTSAPPAGEFLRSLGADLLTGYRFLLRQPQLLWLIFFTFFFNMAYGPLEIALPLYANAYLGGEAVAMGFLWSALAAGALLGSLLFSVVNWKVRAGVTLAAIIALWGVTTLPLAFFTRLDIAVISMALAGFSFTPYNILYRSHLQKNIPPHLLGRVLTSVRMITGTGMPAGAGAAGLLISVLGLQGMFLASSVACIVIGLLALPLLRGLDAPPLFAVQQGSEEPLPTAGQKKVEQGQQM